MKVNNHLLQGENVEHKKTPNTSGSFAAGLPDTIVIHYTAGSSKESAVRILTDPSIKASAHLVIGQDGSIVQLAPFDVITWHAGKSQHEERTGLNKYSIGIEIDNAGVLTQRANGYYSWFNKKYKEDQVVKAIHRNESLPRFWHAYTEAQIETVYEICRILHLEYNIKYILGHDEISPKRKIDPGPAFPINKLRDKILNSARNEDEPETEFTPEEGKVAAKKLNIRSKPDLSAAKIALPLLQGTSVKILEEKNGWYKVRTIIEGWVAAEFVEVKN